MKSIRFYTFALACSVIICTSISCKKNNQTDLTTPNSAGLNHFNQNKAEDVVYAYFGCTKVVDGVATPGIKCAVTTFNPTCAEAKDCCPRKKTALAEFTENEIDLWTEGFDMIHNNEEFINNHYNFYMDLYNDGIGFHPDDIIAGCIPPPHYFQPAPCNMPDGSVGVMCETSVFACEACPTYAECAEVECQKDWGFTDEEIEQWQNGELTFEMTPEFIESHYEFFLYLGKRQITYHPDYILSTIE